MKKLIGLILALVVCCVLAVTATRAQAAPTTCQVCGTPQTWQVLPSSVSQLTEGEHYHFYLSGDVTPGQLLPDDKVTICLDLNGHSIQTNGRSMIVYSGTTVNIMDSSADKTGMIRGSRGDNNAKGGTIAIQENAVLNLHSGTLAFEMDDVGTQKIYQAGVVWIKSGGVMNMSGGTILGGELMNNGSNTVGGGAVCVAANGVLNVSGGTITSGILPEGGVAPCVYMEANTARINLSGSAKVEEIYGPAGCVGVSGTYTGKARMYVTGTLSAGLDVGNAVNASITGDLFCTNGNGWLVNVSGSNLVLAAFTPSAQRHYCTHCKDVVKWTVLTSSNYTQPKNTPGEYHFFLTSDLNCGQMEIKNASAVCLDLYGKNYTSTGRVFHMDVDTQLNIMDTVGGGAAIGTTGTNNPTGGVVVVKNRAVCNLYGGTLKLNTKYVAGFGVGVGGIAYMNESGTMNIYGGTVEGVPLVKSEYKLSTNGVGAAFYMNNAAALNVYGGTVKSGTLAQGCIGECVYVASANAKVTLSGNGTVEDIYCLTENDQVTVSGGYTGRANLTYPQSVALAEGQAVGTAADSADVAGATLTCGDEWLLGVSGGKLVLVPNAPALVYGGEEIRTFDSLQAAVDACTQGYVKLMKPVTENVTVSKDLYLDLNGKTVTGTVTVAEGATLYGMDSQTDDFTVEDAAGYGKLTVAGEGAVAGVPLEAGVAGYGYMKITEDSLVSFHAVNLELTHMVLRPEEAGVYFKSDFAGDELVAQRVKQFGVALSVLGTPTAANLEGQCGYSVFTQFVAGKQDEAATSTLLKGVLKTSRTDEDNALYAQMPVYSRAYILTEDGYLFGSTVKRSFREQAEAVDSSFGTLTPEQKNPLMEMLDTYQKIMGDWGVDNMKAWRDPASDGVLKILGIGNSYTIDTMHLLNAVYQAQKPGTKLQLGIAYYSGCTLASHVKFYNENSAVYHYYALDSETGSWVITKNMTLAQIIDAQNWDMVSMQQGSGSSGLADTYNGDIRTIQNVVQQRLGRKPTFFWNMTWAYPEADIPTDNYTLDNAPNANSFKNYYSSSQQVMYSKIMDAVQTKIVTDSSFAWIMPVGTAVQNAQSSYMDDYDLYRDYTHLSDFARLMAAYTWYCRLEGTTLDQIQLTYVPAALTLSYRASGDMVLTDQQVAVLVESVKNACTTMFEVTPSVYTQK